MGSIINIENFTRFGSARKNLSDAEEKIFMNSESLINKVSGATKGAFQYSDIPCSEFSGNSICSGNLKILITDIPNELRWACPLCGSDGVIKNWRKSPAYRHFRKERLIEKQQEPTTLKLSASNYEYLLTLASETEVLHNILLTGKKEENCYIIPISEFNILRLIEIIALKIEMRNGDRPALSALRDEIINSFSRNTII